MHPNSIALPKEVGQGNGNLRIAAIATFLDFTSHSMYKCAMRFFGILLDLDDTLVDSEAAYKHALLHVGIDPESRAFKIARATVKERLGGGHVSARNRLLYFKEYLLGMGSYSHMRLLDLQTSYEAALSTHIRSQWEKLNRSQLIQNLSRNFKIAVITNENTHTQTIKLKSMDPTGELFPVVVTSEEMGREKPNPLVFHEAFRRLNLKPTECVVVGDSMKNDIEPGVALWCKTILSTEFKNYTGAVPEGVSQIAKLDELLELLQ